MSRKRKQPKGAPVFLQTLSNPPDGSWPQGAFYHGTRIGLLVLLAVAITLLFPSDPGQERGPLPGGGRRQGRHGGRDRIRHSQGFGGVGEAAS